MTTTKAPPHSLEAEQALIGCLLVDAGHLADAAALVNGLSFWHKPYGVIFDAIREMVANGHPVDVVTVADRLQTLGAAKQCGGLGHLNELAEAALAPARAAQYAAIVADRALRRRTLVAVAEAPELVGGAATGAEAVEALQALLGKLAQQQARGTFLSLDELVKQRVQAVSEIAEGRASPGIPTGLGALDKALGGGLKPGKVVTLAARTSVGKTSLALQILLNVAEQKSPSLLFSQEMTGAELAGRAIANRGRIHMDHLDTGGLSEDEWSSIAIAEDALRGLPVYVDDSPALTLHAIQARAREVKRRHGLSLVVVDYLQLCAGDGGKGSDRGNRHHQIEAISRGMKTMAKDLDATVLLLSQLSRAAEEDEPELHHLKESGAIEEDADVVLLLHPWGNEPSGIQTVLCKVAKNRGGPRCRIALGFHGRTQRWGTSSADVTRRGRTSCAPSGRP